jgi:hypothetical protein
MILLQHEFLNAKMVINIKQIYQKCVDYCKTKIGRFKTQTRASVYLKPKQFGKCRLFGSDIWSESETLHNYDQRD